MRLQGRLEVRGSPGIKYSKVEENSARHGRATGVHGRAPEADKRSRQFGCTANHAPMHGWPCVGAWPCRRWVPRDFISVFIFYFPSFLGGLQTILLAALGRNLGFSIASINSIREN